MRYSYSLATASDAPGAPVLTIDGGDPPQVGDHVYVPAAWCPTEPPRETDGSPVLHRVVRVERHLLTHGEDVRVVLAEQVGKAGRAKGKPA